MIKGFKFGYKFCPVEGCEEFMSAHYIKKHLLFFHKYNYTQESPYMPVPRPA